MSKPVRHHLRAWSEGNIARQCDKPECANPYLAAGDLVMAHAWQQGWRYRTTILKAAKGYPTRRA